MIAMSSVMETAGPVIRSEALPREPATRPPLRRRRPLRSAGQIGPGDSELTSGEQHSSPAEGRERLPRVLTGVRVLVVDDDEDNMEVFSAALIACGAAVLTASRAAEALRVLGSQRVDVVVSDIAMPGGDGYWLIREVRQLPDPRFSSLPLLAVTAYGREHSRARVLAAGFAEHLQKPVDPEVLCRAIATAMGR